MQHALDSLDSGPWDYVADPRFKGVDVTAPVIGFLQGPKAMKVLVEMTREESSPLNTDVTSMLESDISRIAFDVRVPEADTMVWTTMVDTPYPNNRIQEGLEQMIRDYQASWDVNVDGDVVLTPTGYKMEITISGLAEAAVNSPNNYRP